jgi:hypothetical protein
VKGSLPVSETDDCCGGKLRQGQASDEVVLNRWRMATTVLDRTAPPSTVLHLLRDVARDQLLDRDLVERMAVVVAPLLHGGIRGQEPRLCGSQALEGLVDPERPCNRRAASVARGPQVNKDPGSACPVDGSLRF